MFLSDLRVYVVKKALPLRHLEHKVSLRKGKVMSFNFNRLTVKAQEVVQSAIEIAQNYNNQIVEPEHVLAAIVQESGNVAENVIKKTGGNFNAVKLKVVQLLETLPKVSGTGLGNQQMSQSLAKIFDVAAEEARNL